MPAYATKEIDHAAYPQICRRRSLAELEFVIADCRSALAAMPDGPKAGYYMDEVHYCHAEIMRRQAGGKRAGRRSPGVSIVADVHAAAGQPLSDDELDALEGLPGSALADELVYLADYQG
jgi:hypothetical protein